MKNKTTKAAPGGLWACAWSYAFILLAAVLLAFNYQLFIVNNGFAPAGLNGIATMIQYKTGFSISYMSLLINIPLSALAFFLVQRDFAVKTLLFSPRHRHHRQ